MNSRKNKILKEIEGGEIKMRPRWMFWLWEAGLKSVWAAVFLMGAVGLSALILFWGEYQPVVTIREYGEVGREVIKSEFPYWWLAMGIFSFLAGSFMLIKIGQMYRQSLNKIMAWMAVATIGASIVFRLLKIAG
jgi:hypothetical protein